MPGESDSFRFEGFQSPKYTQVPDEVFDRLLAILSGAELKVLLYIIRRTFGFKKDADTISLAQITGGITTKDGRVLDHGTGLSKSTTVAAVRSLVEKRIIVATRNSSSDKGDEPTTYSLHMALPVFDNQTPPLLKIEHPRVRESNPQETVLQETEKQDTDLSNIRWAPNGKTEPYDADRQSILAYVDDFAREFADQASLKSSTTRAYKLFRRSGLDREAFTAAMLEARAIAKERSAAIRTATTEPGRPFPTKRKMGYFFAVLEDRLGLKDALEPS